MKTKLLALTLAAFLTGCVTEREVVYKTIRFANTNGVTTAIYYPKTMEKGLKTPHDVERWRHIASKIAPDDGAAKEMNIQNVRILEGAFIKQWQRTHPLTR